MKLLIRASLALAILTLIGTSSGAQDQRWVRVDEIGPLQHQAGLTVVDSMIRDGALRPFKEQAAIRTTFGK